MMMRCRQSASVCLSVPPHRESRYKLAATLPRDPHLHLFTTAASPPLCVHSDGHQPSTFHSKMEKQKPISIIHTTLPPLLSSKLIYNWRAVSVPTVNPPTSLPLIVSEENNEVGVKFRWPLQRPTTPETPPATSNPTLLRTF